MADEVIGEVLKGKTLSEDIQPTGGTGLGGVKLNL